MESIKLKFLTNETQFDNDYKDMVRAFYPYVVLNETSENFIKLDLEEIENKKYKVNICLDIKCLKIERYYENVFNLEKSTSLLEIKSLKKRISKIKLYEVLSELTGVNLPYGSLTGIRPTKLFRETLEKGIDAKKYFEDELHVSLGKVDLISRIVKNQDRVYTKDERYVDVFVNIPICTTRCSYCSFLAAELCRVKNLICPYTQEVVEEIEMTKKIIKEKGFIVKSVYIGGGTPTSIDDESFEKIVSAANFNCSEYTVEAGRPDTITREKLDIMSKCGVTRISINPQSFCQKTLDLIGRKHTIQDIFDVYKMAREYSFDINMDLIAMLPGETFEDFKYSVDTAISLNPDNITVHTLALKKGSKLMENNYSNVSENLPSKMVDYAMNAILNAGYEPYYMYRQKHMSGNLENVGYCKKNKECIYNIDIMEETTSIIANGAGAISKKLDISKNQITRLPEAKGLDVYLHRKDSIIEDKYNFFIN